MLPKLKKTNCIILLTGTIIQAIGIYNIHALSNVTEGGVLGLTLLIRHWLGISPAVSSLVLNICCYAFGWKTLGKHFVGYSLLSIVIYSACYSVLELFPPLWPNIGQFPLLAAVAGALFIGIGAGLCVRAGGTTAGDDAPCHEPQPPVRLANRTDLSGHRPDCAVSLPQLYPRPAHRLFPADLHIVRPDHRLDSKNPDT